MTAFDRMEQLIDETYDVSMLAFVLLKKREYALCRSRMDCLKMCWFPQDKIPDDWIVIKDSLFSESLHVPRFDRDYMGRQIEITVDGLERKV